MPPIARDASAAPVCPTCTAPLTGESSFCRACGTPVSQPGDGSSGSGPRFDFIDSADPTPTPTVSRRVLAAAANPAATRISPWTLRFASPVLEEAFDAEHRLTTLRNAPVAAALAVALITAFGLLDVIIQPTIYKQLWVIRFGILDPYFILLLGACYVPRFRPYVERGLIVGVVVAGASVLAMILISPAPGRYFYYAGLILVIMYGYTVTRIQFAIVNALGWSVAGAYLAAELIVGRTPWQILVNNMFFFGSACIVGMFAAYVAESLARQNFLQDKLVRRAREFGSYRLVAKLGQGGMGEVWRAQHRLLARPAAIKLIRSEVLGIGDAAARRRIVHRFEREAQATALLRSPHTIELYDFGVTEDGTFYYVMELLQGYDLHTLVRRFGCVHPQRAIRFLLQACDSLAEAHENNLIHRDVKPANIYACRYGRRADFVKLLDFGIAAWTGPAPGRGTEATLDRFAGTPSSMAPEQVHGEQPVDGRADLYGLGCVAYWLLTGRPVFEGDNDLQVLARHVGTPPAPPSSRAPQPIPPDLEDVVLWCLQKDPADRPQSADDLATRLAGCLTTTGWSDADAREWWDANPPAEDAAPVGQARTLVPSVAV